MCQRVTCASCGKPSFVGCGKHVEQVLGDVPKADRCQCNASQSASASPSLSDSAGANARPAGR